MENTNVCQCCQEEKAGVDFTLYCNECGYSMDQHEIEDEVEYDNSLDIRAETQEDFRNEFYAIWNGKGIT